MSARRYVITGLVQGVGFRWYVRKRAHALGVTGYVRNRADGAVEVVAAGSDAAIASLEADLRRGPPSARVEAVQTSTAEQPTGAGFEIIFGGQPPA